MVFVIPSMLQTGLMGVDFPDSGREWMSRFRAVGGVYATMWIALMAASLYGPLLVIRGLEHAKPVLSGMTLTWVLTTVGSLLAGNSEKTGRDKEGTPKFSWLQVLAKIGPPVFVAGLLVLLATLEQYLLVYVGRPNGMSLADIGGDYWCSLDPWPLVDHWRGVLLRVTAAQAGVAVILAWRVDMNEFPMHHFYKNRLVRCYLGASHEERKPNPFTGFDESDDISLSSLIATSEDPYEGPYPIVNATLNLSAGEQLAWQERKAASFIFSPCFCGFDLANRDDEEKHATPSPGDNKLRQCAYRDTRAYAMRRGPNLGTAMSISGAAASPNQGYNTSAAVAFLMTIFDVRLGWWVGNPRRDAESERPSPRFGMAALLSDLLGKTDSRTRFVNLSDGGHFDNMGIYELVRRRCRFIILCDAEADDSYRFGGLGMAIRKCRVDFGAHIHIDPSRIVPDPEKNTSDTHCAVGSIRYLDGSRGTLVYIKASVTGDEPEDVLQYRASRAGFPHESTADQWFDESQFESYRALGYHATDQTVAPSESWQPWDPSKPVKNCSMHSRTTGIVSIPTCVPLLPNTPRPWPNYWIRSGRSGLQQLGAQLFPNSGIIPLAVPRNPAQEFYFCMAVIQLVEDLYFEFELDEQEWLDDPRIGGWRTLFRTWKSRP